MTWLRRPPLPEINDVAEPLLHAVRSNASLNVELANYETAATGAMPTMDQQAEDENYETFGVGSNSWSKFSLGCAYAGLYLMTFATSLEGQTSVNIAPIVTSSFGAHSLISTVYVVQAVVNAVIKPPMAKISDVFGRFEAFCIAVVVFVIGYVEMAAADDMATYASAQIFYSAGSTGLQILQQVFIADTTSLANRAIFSVIPGLPFLATVWIGPSLAQTILSRTTWRWNYGIWSIVLPTTFAPLAISLYFHRKRSKSVQVPTIPYSEGQEKKSIYQFLRNLWFDLDLFGLVLLTAGISLVLVPLTLAPRAAGGWANQSMVAMLVVGAISLSIFPFWERSKAFAPHALFPPQLFANRTTLAGTALAFFYFMAFYLSIYPYYYSYLLVVEDLDITTAGRITQTFSFSSAITAFIISWLIKWTGNYKYFVIFGVCIYTLGMGLMLHYRQPDTSLAALIGCQITIGIGGGLVLAPAQLGVQASAERGQVAAVTAVFLTVLEIGGAVGNAVSGAIWSSYIPKQLTLYLPVDRQDQVALIYDSVTYASEHFAQGTVERNAINHAYQDTMSVLLVIAICMAVPCIFLSLCMENYKLQEMDQRQPGPVTGEEYGTTATDNTPSSMCDTPRETHVCT